VFYLTIAAISTPNAVGGIAVIRISGENALEAADSVFCSVSGKKAVEMNGYTCTYGYAHDNGERIDDCILTVFHAPNSYTGEDVAELSCHGGLFVTKRILRTILRYNVRPAQAGEFTKRAFINGKIDLTQAEAVMDIIAAKGGTELKMAETLRDGAAFRRSQSIKHKLVAVLGDLAAWADYPDDDIPEVEPQTLKMTLTGIRDDLAGLIKGYDYGKILREGINTVIIGRPNVGKSTLFNCLSGCERSIVTEIAGTTRDVIEESVRIGDFTLRLSDTAGIHETSDIIEGIGVDIAYKRLDEAALIIAVFDGSSPLTADDTRLLQKLRNKRTIAVVNKNDVVQNIETEIISEITPHVVYVSAKDNTGIEQIQRCIEVLFKANELDPEDATVANERQKQCIDLALEQINEAIAAIDNGELLDAVTVLLDEAVSHILELTGEVATEAVVDEVFSRFCVGK
jgi:tRNA modification GTPase